jgi:hypothetical protein
MIESLTFARLDAVLMELGFTKTVTPKSHITYRHESSDTVMYFPIFRSADLVPTTSIIGTRKVLVDRGVVEADRLDEMLQAAAA